MFGATAGTAVLSAARRSSEPGADGSDDRSVGPQASGGPGDAVLAVFEGPERARIIDTLARKYRLAPDAAEEWCQEAYLNLHTYFSVPGRRAPEDPVAYVFTTVRNLVNRSWRRAGRDREVLVEEPPVEEPLVEDPLAELWSQGDRHDGDPVRAELELEARRRAWPPWLLSATLSFVTLATADGPLEGLPRPRAETVQVLGWQALHLAGRGDLCAQNAPANVRQNRSRAIRRVMTEVQAAYQRAAERGEVEPRG
jgi:hypothetical protein